MRSTDLELPVFPYAPDDLGLPPLLAAVALPFFPPPRFVPEEQAVRWAACAATAYGICAHLEQGHPPTAAVVDMAAGFFHDPQVTVDLDALEELLAREYAPDR